MSELYDEYISSETYEEDERLDTNNGSEIQSVIYTLGVDSIGNMVVRNPDNTDADITLSWLNNIARLRIGGVGVGVANGFQIQGVGDKILFNLNDNGVIEVENRIGATLQNSWVNFSGFATASYYKDIMNRIHLTGTVANGITTSGTVIFNLPLGYRPEAREIHNVLCGGDTIGRVDVYPDGNVAVHLCSNNTYLSLAGISFRAI